MEDEEARRGGNGTRRQRTDSSRRRPHSQPDRLLSVSCRSPAESSISKGKDPAQPSTSKPSAEGESAVKVFKRREPGSRAAPAADESKISKPASKPNAPTPKPNVCTEKWAPKLKSRPPAEPESKKRRQRLILEGSDDDEGDSDSAKNNSERKDSPVKKEDIKAEGVAVRKSSRVVKRRTFDDEIDFEEVVRRRKKSSDKPPAKQPEPWAEENTDDVSAEDEQPRKKPRRGSIQELQKEKPAPKPKPAPPLETPTPKEKRSTRKEASVSEQPSPSIKDEALHSAASPGDSGESVEKANATPLTARQRSLQACKEGGDARHGFIEFPEGLNGSDRRRRSKLTDEEKLAKKAEAASKRKQQVEKAAKEIQASAIQKILNQDSNRKKREDRIQKQKQELAEERKAAELETATNSIRLVMGPSGTTISWAQDAQMPSLFSGGISYPPPREKCAACENVYKYRDSKSKVPLCSLQCYKAIREAEPHQIKV